jgi:hypothetical protein
VVDGGGALSGTTYQTHAPREPLVRMLRSVSISARSPITILRVDIEYIANLV